MVYQEDDHTFNCYVKKSLSRKYILIESEQTLSTEYRYVTADDPTSEYDEWGNPNSEPYYQYMLSYSPYDNVQAVTYPHMLVTTGLHDSQVQDWEPAKWVAKLRALKAGHQLLLLKTNMEAGHGGASGRFNRLKEIAFRDAFLLRLAGGAVQPREECVRDRANEGERE